MDYKTIGQPTKIHNMTFYNCDCMELLKETPDKYYELAICDPPYGIGMGGGLIGNSKQDYKQFAGEDNSIPQQEYWNELFRVSKNQIVWGGNYMIKYLHPTSCFIIWDKVQPEQFTMAMAELAWTSFNSPAKIYKQRIVGADDIRIHPTQKPVALYKWLLKNYAKEGDKILDTHLGSGSIGIACHYMGFNLTGCELDKEYFDSAMERIKNQTTQQTLL
jgi:site-specific DNA-methyltransferase (adenine-specific)